MQIKHLLQDEDAVSPVIGVILMVAITVILAAVIGTFVLGLGDQVQSSAPNANFNFEYSGDWSVDASSNDAGTGEVGITHNGGQDIEGANLDIQLGDYTIADPVNNGTSNTNFGETVSTGSSFRYNESNFTNTNSDVQTGQTVRVIWQSDSGGSSNTIGESTIPA